MGQGRGKGGDLGRSFFEGVLRGGGQVVDQKKIRQGAGRPLVVLGPERLIHFRHNNNCEMAIWQVLVCAGSGIYKTNKGGIFSRGYS